LELSLALTQRKPDMRISKRLLLGLGLTTLLVESLAFHPALGADKVSLFKVITTRDEIVIGIPEAEFAKMDGNAGGVEGAGRQPLAERLAIRGAQIILWRSRTGTAAQDRGDFRRLAAN
jgi:hypothetical protein